MLFKWCQTATGSLAIYLLHATFQWGLNILPQEAEKKKKGGLKKEDKSNKSQSYYPKLFFF